MNNARSPRPLSFWLIPRQPEKAALETLMAGLVARHGTPRFEAHLTVLGDVTADPAAAATALRSATAGLGPLSLGVRGVGCSDAFFKSVFVEMVASVSLLRLSERLRAALPGAQGYVLQPHLSLIYADMPVAMKEAIGREIRIEARTIEFDEAAAVTPGNAEQGWRDVTAWREVLRVKLER